jgi:hypothetical protein
MKRLFLLLALLAAIPFELSAQVGGVTAELSVDQQQFMPDEDMNVSLQIMNRSGQTVEFGKDPAWVTFSIQGENNMVAQNMGEVPTGGEFSLISGQMGTKHFNLAPYFSFHQTGHYRVVATIRIPQWNQEITSKPATFSVMNGAPVPNLPDLTFGVPPMAGETNSLPEVRKYVLLKATYLTEPRIYFRLTDATGTKTLRTYPLGRVVSFAQPDAQLDASSNLHLLYQRAAKSFSYFVINPDGRMLVRQTHDFTQSRPTLRVDSEGRIYVAGGVRLYRSDDWPTPAPSSFPTTTNTASQ